jgi:uncharacterized membrane protein YphA (DoxX/SURF4 family)/peroxiredoxin
LKTKLLTHIARFLVAATFIFSGFVKLVDPIGSAIKFEEYFSEDVLNLTFLIPYALPFSVILIMVELLLGVMLLVGFKPKLTVWGTAILMFVFLFLTWYSAYFNKVTDCGCFGDAIKLSSWGTFYKNIFFSALILILLFNRKHINTWFGKIGSNWIPFITLLGGLFVSYYVLQHLPIIDFRPFAIGNSIPQGMEYVDGEDFPPIHDFILENNTDDLTNTVLQAEKVLLVITYNLNTSEITAFEKLKSIAEKAQKQGYLVYTLSASSMDDYKTIQEQYQLPFDMLYCDETTLKTMIRANPGIMALEKGIIKGKWNWTDIDKVKLK